MCGDEGTRLELRGIRVEAPLEGFSCLRAHVGALFWMPGVESLLLGGSKLLDGS